MSTQSTSSRPAALFEDSSERALEEALATIFQLRKRVVDAWQERAITLTREEQAQLKDEIEATAFLLNGLTARA